MMEILEPSVYKMMFEEKVEELMTFYNSFYIGTEVPSDFSHKLHTLQAEVEEAHRRWFIHRRTRADHNQAMKVIQKKLKYWRGEQMSNLDCLLEKTAVEMLVEFLPIGGTPVVQEKLHLQSCKICRKVVRNNMLELHMHHTHWMERK